MTDDLRARFEAIMRAPPTEWEDQLDKMEDGQYKHYRTFLCFDVFLAGILLGAQMCAEEIAAIPVHAEGDGSLYRECADICRKVAEQAK